MVGASGRICSSSALTSATSPSAPMSSQGSLKQHNTKLNTSKSSAVGVWIKKMPECPALHWRWDLHICGDLINKHSFVEISYVSKTEEALERTCSATHKHPFCGCKYLFFYVRAICFPAYTVGKNKDAEHNRYDGAWSGQHQIFRRAPSGLRGKKSACDFDLHEMLAYRLCLLVNSRKPSTGVLESVSQKHWKFITSHRGICKMFNSLTVGMCNWKAFGCWRWEGSGSFSQASLVS